MLWFVSYLGLIRVLSSVFSVGSYILVLSLIILLSCWTIEWPLEGGLCYETNTVRIRGLLEWWLDCLAILLPPWQHCGTSYRLLRLHDKTWRNDLELKNWGFIKIYLFLKQYSYRILQIPRCWHQVLDYFIMYLLQYVKRLISVLLQRVTFSHSIPGSGFCRG